MAAELLSPPPAKKVAVKVLFRDNHNRAFFPPGFGAAYGGLFHQFAAAGYHPALHPSAVCQLPPPPTIPGMLYGQ